MPTIKNIAVKTEPIVRKWLNAREACEYIGCGKTFLRELREKNLVVWASSTKHENAGRSLLWYNVESLDKYIESRQCNTAKSVELAQSII